MYLTTDNLAHYLMSRGIIVRQDIIEGDFVAVETSRRNRNFRVLRRQAPSLFVKQIPTIVPENIGSIRREAECCTLIAKLPDLAPLRPFVPRLIDFNGVDHVVVMEFAHDGENLNEQLFRTQSFSELLGRLQGHALGTIHAVTARFMSALDAEVTFPKTKPWFFAALHQPQLVLPNMTAPMREAIEMLRQLPDVMTALSIVQADWTPSCLSHGDVKWDNFVVVPREDGSALMVVDWELADIGDPCWDVAGVLAAYVQYWLFYVHPQPGTDGGRGKLGQLQASVAAFWDEYQSCVRLAPLDADKLLMRSIFRVGVRLLQTVIETQGTATAPLPTTSLLLNVARHIFANVALCRKDIFGFPDAASAGRALSQPAQDAAARPLRPAAAHAPDEPDNDLPQDLAKVLRTICGSVRIESPVSFRFDDEPPISIQLRGGQAEIAAAYPTLRTAGTDLSSRNIASDGSDLVEALWPILYRNFYTRGRIAEAGDNGAAGAAALKIPDTDFLDRLSAANKTPRGWDPAWQVYQLDVNGAVHARKGECFRLVLPGHFASEPGRAVTVGDRISIRTSRESRTMVPGFYFVFSSTVGSEFDEALLCRIYFNVSADGACNLVEWLTRTLNRYDVPFRLKCLDRRTAYDDKRADSAVLFIARRYADFVVRTIAADHGVLQPELNPEVPLFTRRLAPGVAIADDPRTGESFGQSRMRLVSRGLVNAWYDGTSDTDVALAAINDAFRTAGVSLQRPHLNAGNADFGEWLT
ncbi:MAG: T3SS effector HopA1 family protein [Xanthobacteraceae bacterium]